MIQAQPFGKIHSITLHPGDIVKWSIWNKDLHAWEKRYGVIIKVKNKIKSNRLVSISEVYVYDREEIVEFFTLSLKKLGQNEEFSGSYSDIG